MMFELRVLDGLRQGAALPLFGEQWSIGAQAPLLTKQRHPGALMQTIQYPEFVHQGLPPYSASSDVFMPTSRASTHPGQDQNAPAP